MEPKAVILVAGGKGLRMGADCPKQFLELSGKPVLMHSMEAFHQADPNMPIVLVLPVEHQAFWQDLCNKCAFRVPHVVANGGVNRFESVRNGLKWIQDAAFVAVHDGVRPLVSKALIDRCFDEAFRYGAVVPWIPVQESLRFLNETSCMAVDRERYRVVQTPQVFRTDWLREAYSQAYESCFTDDASVVERIGYTVHGVEGDIQNIKITRPVDLVLAAYYLKQKR